MVVVHGNSEQMGSKDSGMISAGSEYDGMVCYYSNVTREYTPVAINRDNLDGCQGMC